MLDTGIIAKKIKTYKPDSFQRNFMIKSPVSMGQTIAVITFTAFRKLQNIWISGNVYFGGFFAFLGRGNNKDTITCTGERMREL